jgi:hypothetical protein
MTRRALGSSTMSIVGAVLATTDTSDTLSGTRVVVCEASPAGWMLTLADAPIQPHRMINPVVSAMPPAELEQVQVWHGHEQAALRWELGSLSVDIAPPHDGAPRNRAERRAAGKRVRRGGR